MPVRVKRKRGGQSGNQNARKHGFYSSVLTPEQQGVLSLASRVPGLDREAAVLRLKIASILKNDPDNIALLAQAMSSLAYLMRTRQHLANTEHCESRDLYKRFVSWLKEDLSRPVPVFVPTEPRENGSSLK